MFRLTRLFGQSLSQSWCSQFDWSILNWFLQVPWELGARSCLSSLKDSRALPCVLLSHDGGALLQGDLLGMGKSQTNCVTFLRSLNCLLQLHCFGWCGPCRSGDSETCAWLAMGPLRFFDLICGAICFCLPRRHLDTHITNKQKWLLRKVLPQAVGVLLKCL